MNQLSTANKIALGGLGLALLGGGLYFAYRGGRKSDLLPESVFVTCTSPVNIAVIKYWGKRDVKLNLPLNSSLSGTLSQEEMRSTTTIMASLSFTEDEIWLNGRKEDINNERIQKCLEAICSRAGDFKADGKVLIPKEAWPKYRVRIVSMNNFPTAAGLASSASGYCALVYTLAQLYRVEGDVSTIARMGSGSACRSLYGGWVKWEVGSLPDGSDSMAVQVKDENHWPEIQVLVCVVNDQKKDTSSTDGMQNSVATSKLMKIRAESVVPERMRQMERAIAEKDFQTFADLTMKDSDSFHEVCADTTPPIFYLRQTSKDIIKIIQTYNEKSGELKAAYTFDAGPNAVIYLPKQNIPAVLALLLHYFPPNGKDEASFFKNTDLLKESKKVSLEGLDSIATGVAVQPNALKYVLHTTIGPGPKVLGESESLIDRNGQPKHKVEDAK